MNRSWEHFSEHNTNSTMRCQGGDHRVQPPPPPQFKKLRLWFLILTVKVISFHWGLCGCGKSSRTRNQMALLKDGGHLTKDPSVDFVSWHRPSVTAAQLAWVVGCCSPFAFTLDRQVNLGAPLYNLGYIPLTWSLCQSSTQSNDGTGSTASGTTAICENG